MKIEAIANIVHPKRRVAPGETVELPDAEAQSLIDRGMARKPRPRRTARASESESPGHSDEEKGDGSKGGGGAPKGEANQKVG